MNQHPFIFSNKLKYRLNRHLVFWLCWWAFCSILYAYLPVPDVLPFAARFLISATEALIFLPVHMFVAYSMVYLLVPYLLIRGRYVYSVIALGVLFLATAVINAFFSPYVGTIRNFILTPLFQFPLPSRFTPISFHYSMMAGLRGGVTVGGIAAAIKLMKYWYIKEQRNLQLQKENSEAQLELLKAQIHPHFLFNTMNNIYSYTQNSSPVAANLVMGLSDMLRYMLYEGNQSIVPLRKELKMIDDYIKLEQVRYDERLDVHLEMPGNTDGYYIAPLLLLPLVENCFKHGLSNMVEQPWISLRISLEGNYMILKLVNGKASGYQPINTSKCIGL
jgi:sensor histidine kinase YesM